jgi:hypothetical protein
MNLQVEDRPVVQDCPDGLRYTGPREDVRLLYRKCVGATDWVEVIGDPDNGGYEWVIRNEAGKIIEHSNDGYGSTDVALRDGIAAYYHEASVGETRDMANILRKLVQADDRDGFSERLRRKINVEQGGECDDADAWMLASFDEARAMVKKLNAKI